MFSAVQVSLSTCGSFVEISMCVTAFSAATWPIYAKFGPWRKKVCRTLAQWLERILFSEWSRGHWTNQRFRQTYPRYAVHPMCCFLQNACQRRASLRQTQPHQSNPTPLIPVRPYTCQVFSLGPTTLVFVWSGGHKLINRVLLVTIRLRLGQAFTRTSCLRPTFV